MGWWVWGSGYGYWPGTEANDPVLRLMTSTEANDPVLRPMTGYWTNTEANDPILDQY